MVEQFIILFIFINVCWSISRTFCHSLWNQCSPNICQCRKYLHFLPLPNFLFKYINSGFKNINFCQKSLLSITVEQIKSPPISSFPSTHWIDIKHFRYCRIKSIRRALLEGWNFSGWKLPPNEKCQADSNENSISSKGVKLREVHPIHKKFWKCHILSRSWLIYLWNIFLLLILVDSKTRVLGFQEGLSTRASECAKCWQRPLHKLNLERFIPSYQWGQNTSSGATNYFASFQPN